MSPTTKRILKWLAITAFVGLVVAIYLALRTSSVPEIDRPIVEPIEPTSTTAQ